MCVRAGPVCTHIYILFLRLQNYYTSPNSSSLSSSDALISQAMSKTNKQSVRQFFSCPTRRTVSQKYALTPLCQQPDHVIGQSTKINKFTSRVEVRVLFTRLCCVTVTSTADLWPVCSCRLVFSHCCRSSGHSRHGGPPAWRHRPAHVSEVYVIRSGRFRGPP